MGVPGNANALLLRSAAAAGGYQVSRSLRFNSADSAYLSRTFSSSASSSNKLTYSTWVKRTKVGSGSAIETFGLAAAVSGSSRDAIWFSGDSLEVYFNEGASGIAATSAVFRDVSAWYHVVVSIDTTKATAADRIIIYVNGVRQTVTGTQPSQNYNFTGFLVSGKEQNIGRSPQPAYYADSYLAEIHCIDGLALDPTSFAETDATTAQWIPKLYTGSYGTNGFKLNFSDNSSNTATTLGKDTANSNNWTPNNFSVTAGAGNDSLVDTPTSYGTDTGAGGEVRGNYCTMNPLSGGTFTNGNLDQSSSDVNNYGTFAVSTGKWYYEAVISVQTGSGVGGQKIGLAKQGAAFELGNDANGWAMTVQNNSSNGNAINNGTQTSSYTTYTTNDVVMCAFDVDAGKIWWGKNGTWLNSGAPASGTNAIYTNLTGPVFPAAIARNGSAFTWNFGQRAFAYTAPSGFKALVDTNLTAPVIAKPNTVMDVKLYTGNGSTQTISGLNFSPDWIWFKQRNTTRENHLYDSVRGVQKALYTDLTNAEATDTDALSSFNSDGWTMGADGGSNQNGGTYVAWCWDAGSSTVTNTQGSITASLRANPSSGFSVSTFTGATTGTIGHGLGVAPSMIFIKARTSNPGANDWFVYHKDLGNTKYLMLNSTAAQGTYTIWNNTSPTSTVFSIGSGIGTPDWVAYCFAPVAGYSSFGSYTGNGSTDGPFVFTGHRSRWIMLKRTDTAADWYIFDTARNTYNALTSGLFPNASDAEATNSLYAQDVVANGWKIRSSQTQFNASGGTYIYAAFAENPFQYARAR